MNTEELIARLASEAAPFRPLPRPAVRWAGWSAVAIASGAAGVAVFGVRPHLADVVVRPEFVSTAIVALAASALAAGSSLVLAIPGAERTPVARRAVAGLMIVWGAILAAAIVSAGHGFSRASDWPICFIRVIAIGSIPALVLFGMIRRAAPLRLSWTSALATVAATSLAALTIQFVCPIDDAAHALLGHFGPVVVLGAIGAWAARTLLK